MKKLTKILQIILLNLFLCAPFPVVASSVSEIEKYLDSFNSEIGLNGNVLVSQNGKILLSKSYGYSEIASKKLLTPQSQFYIGSITKQFTAVAILKLVQEQKLSLTDHITVLIPEFKSTEWAQGVTVEHLLSHTSGIAGPDSVGDRKSGPFTTIHELLNHLKNKTSLSKPGELFRYSNDGYFVLGYLVEKINKKLLGRYFQENFFEPLGMHASVFETIFQPNNTKQATALAAPHVYKNSGEMKPIDKIPAYFVFSAGGIISTVEDLKKWNDSLYGGSIIPLALVEKFVSPRLDGYALGIGVVTLANGSLIYFHNGGIDGYHAVLAYLPKQKITICVLSNGVYPVFFVTEALMLHLSCMMMEKAKIPGL